MFHTKVLLHSRFQEHSGLHRFGQFWTISGQSKQLDGKRLVKDVGSSWLVAPAELQTCCVEENLNRHCSFPPKWVLWLCPDRKSWARVSGAKLVTTFSKILGALTATKEGEISKSKSYHFYMNNKCTGTLTSQEPNLEPSALELSHTCCTAIPLVL